MTFLRNHFGLAGAALACVAAFALGWFLHRPAVEVHWLEHTHVERVENKVEVDRRVEGPVKITTRWLAAPPAPRSGTGSCPASAEPPVVLVEQVEERGPVIEDRRIEDKVEEKLDVVREKTETPAPPRMWAATVGLQLAPDRVPHLALGRRLIGPVWAEAWIQQPLELRAPALGVGVRIEF